MLPSHFNQPVPQGNMSILTNGETQKTLSYSDLPQGIAYTCSLIILGCSELCQIWSLFCQCFVNVWIVIHIYIYILGQQFAYSNCSICLFNHSIIIVRSYQKLKVKVYYDLWLKISIYTVIMTSFQTYVKQDNEDEYICFISKGQFHCDIIIFSKNSFLAIIIIIWELKGPLDCVDQLW